MRKREEKEPELDKVMPSRTTPKLASPAPKTTWISVGSQVVLSSYENLSCMVQL